MRTNTVHTRNLRCLLTGLVVAALVSLTALVSCTDGGMQKAGNEDRASRVVEKVIEAYGGAGAIEAVSSIHAKGDIKAFVREGRGPYEYYLKRPGKLRVEIRYENQTELRILNGEKGWRGRFDGPVEEATGMRYLAMLYQYMHLDLPYVLLKGLYDISWEEGDRIGDVEVDVLVIKSPNGPPLKAYVDSNSGLIIKTRGYFTVKGTDTYLSAEYSDFVEAGGTKLPGRIVNYGAGRVIGETVLSQYIINPAVEDSIFRPAK